MKKEDIYKMLFQCMGECWEWANDKPKSAIQYFEGLWTMAHMMIEKIDEENNLPYTVNKTGDQKSDDLSHF